MANPRATVYRNLAVTLEAGLPIRRALDSAASGANRTYRRVFTDIEHFVAAGNTISQAMARHRRTFAPLDILIVQAGEHGGNLPGAFAQLARWYELCDRIRRIIKSGLLLPALLIHAAAFVPALPFFLFGRIPLGQYLSGVWHTLMLFYIPAAIIFAIVRFTPSTGPLRRLFDIILIKTPLLGRAVGHLALSRYCQAFSLLCRAGVSASDSAGGAAGVTGNSVMTDRLKPGATSALAGHPISQGFSPRLPAEFREAWHIGEETGDIDEVSQRLADNFAYRAELTLTELSHWLPRIIYLLICLHMAHKIVSMYSQMYTF